MWQYTAPTYAPALIPEGNYRVRISGLTWDVSKSGNTMLVSTLKVSGYKETLKYYNVLKSESQDAINRSNYYLKKFCDAFCLNPEQLNSPNFNLNSWYGAEAGATIAHESNNGATRSIIKKFLTRKQLDFLNPFVDAYMNKEPQQQQQAQTQQYNNLPPQSQNFNTNKDMQQWPENGFNQPQAQPPMQIPF